MVFLSFSDMACSVAGITSDANVLTNELRLIAQRYSFDNLSFIYVAFCSTAIVIVNIKGIKKKPFMYISGNSYDVSGDNSAISHCNFALIISIQNTGDNNINF